jgi:hypothetical protein
MWKNTNVGVMYNAEWWAGEWWAGELDQMVKMVCSVNEKHSSQNK